ncbi:MAG: hypothetical protein K0B81_01780 [Candidatus Cloacimonetes bacterium]|nr:hypothetical protein [Candidatus Cloacimonadota bacterium]
MINNSISVSYPNKKHLQTLGLLLLCFFFYPGLTDNFQGNLYAEIINKYPLDSIYHRQEDILPSLWELVDINPEFVHWEVIGHSSNEKLPIYAFMISNPNTGSEFSKPSVLFHGQHHSEEPIGVEIIFFLSRYFLSEYGKDNFITFLLDNYNLWFVPTMNPEGFRIVNQGYYRLKRKNNTDTNMNGVFEIDRDGVDLNRNYPFNWEEDEMDDPESPYFKGYEPVSQSEVRAMIDFYKQKRFQLAFFYHSSASGTYSERIFFPWRWGEEMSPDYYEMLYLAEILAQNLPRTYTRGNYNVHRFNTSRTGFARDYIYSEHGTLAMLIEVGGNSPYGEGVVNPPNNVLQEIKRKHTRAMLRLLQEYDKNLLIGKVKGYYELPLSNTEIIFGSKQNPYKKNLLTNQRGYFFYYLKPSETPFNILINNLEFLILKEEDQRIEYSFYIDTEKELPVFKERVNNGEAIIMTNPVFQYFPPLRIENNQDDNDGPIRSLYLTLSKGLSLLYRQEMIIEIDGEFNFPWIPTNLTDKGFLTIQSYERNRFLDNDNDKLENKIIFLQDKNEILTYASDYNPLNSWYLHPETMIGIDYSLYPAGNNDYLIKEVRIAGNENFRSDNLELILYAAADKIYQTRSFSNGDDFINFSVPDVPLPDNLFLVIANRGYQPFSIYKERGYSVSSKRMFVHYFEWQTLNIEDLAIEIHLIKD